MPNKGKLERKKSNKVRNPIREDMNLNKVLICCNLNHRNPNNKIWDLSPLTTKIKKIRYLYRPI